ncbi:MAG: serine/threonine protein kinase [Planctomycetes bacterium]|nr:serine/threonine protein kinase [Planctomycetota bacterium]
MTDGRRSKLETALLDSRLLTSDEAAEASACEGGLAGWLRRGRLLPPALIEQAERGEPLRLGRYVVMGRLGKGGMGAVLRARDDALGREVALKVVRPDGGDEPETLRERFRREALALARLDHPGVVRVYDLEALPDGLMVLAMERVEGCSVEERIRRGPLPERDAQRLLRQVTQAMIAAEAQGIVHRDLKPGNVLWVAEGDVYKVCDFGLARFQREAPSGGGQLTQACTVLGTPFYMSPEQVAGDALDARSDMYSLGLSLHEVVTGKVPFAGPRLDEVLRRRLREDVPNLRRVAPHVSPGLARVVAWMTQRDRARRPATWKALASELAALGDSERLRRASGERARAAPAARPPGPRVPVVALVALALAAGAALGALAAWLGR